MIIYKYFPAHDQEAFAILHEIQDFLKIDCQAVEIFHIYAFEDETQRGRDYRRAFDKRYGEIIPPELPDNLVFIKDKDGQYNQVQDQSLRYLRATRKVTSDLRYFGGAIVFSWLSPPIWTNQGLFIQSARPGRTRPPQANQFRLRDFR